jgi:prephenate dehydrogenase
MAAEPSFRRAVILGTGLIGGSFGLALRKFAPGIRVAGWNRGERAREAQARGAVQEAFSGALAPALADADLVYLALPVGAILDHLPEIMRLAPPGALVTDAGSTKLRISHLTSELAGQTSGPGPLMLPAHPLAGKEVAGIANADADLFQRTAYALAGDRRLREEPRVRSFVSLVERIGARPLWIGPEEHDQAVAMASHLPQVVAVALASFLYDRLDEEGLPITLAGPGLRDSLRLAGSPYAVWRDILLTNRENIAAALELLSCRLEDLRERLASRAIEADFDAANELYKLLRDLQ